AARGGVALRAAGPRAHVELFAAKRPAAPQPARPRIELFGARGASPGGTGAGSAGGVRPANPYAGSPGAGSAYAGNLSKKQEA
ncbi:chemoreceptor glutamine deamidase CheD, partial [Burkholderia diffusa]|nr:chemoreceptor glutamine deamidase CheD [Burkholderia diffusa]